MRRILIALGVVAVALALAGPATPAIGKLQFATLSGANEAPGPGDPDGAGSAIVLNMGNHGIACWFITASGIGPVAAAHIHRGPAGVAGPIVIDFAGQLSGCTRASRDLLVEIRTNPAGFYVNVHTPEFPAGAIRGQLSNS